MIALTILAALFAGVAVALGLRALALPRMRAAERVQSINAYGFAATAPVVAAPVRRDSTGPLSGLAGWLGDRVASRVGLLKEQSMRRELLAAGMYRTTPRLLMGYRVLAAAALPLAFVYLLGQVLPAVLVPFLLAYCALAGWMLPLILVHRRARLRLTQIDRALPGLIDLLVVTVEAGLGFAAALQLAAGRIHGPLAVELRLALQEQQMGLATKESLTHMLERADTPAMRSFVRSIVQGETLGVSIGTIMRNLAIEMRKIRRAAAEEQAQKAPTKILFPLVFLILPSLGIVVLGPALFEIALTFEGI